MLHAQTRPTSRPVAKPAAAANAAPVAKADPKLTVAVLDFESTSSTPDLGKQIGEALTATLSDEAGFKLLDRASLSKTLQEHELSLTGLAKPEDAVRIGQIAGAKLLITGKAFTLDKSLFITAKIIGTETSEVEGVVVKGPLNADISTLVTELSAKLADRIRTKGGNLIAAAEPADPIPALKAKLALKKLPKLAIQLTETHYGEAHAHPIDPAVETELCSVLKQLGFEVVDDEKANLADQGVDAVIKGEAFSEFAAHVGNLVSCSARAEVKMTQRKSGDLILSDRATARAADLSENMAGKTALQNAGHELALRIAQHFVDQPATAPTK